MKKKLLLIIPAVIILIVSITVVLTKKSDNPKQVFQDNNIKETSKKEEIQIVLKRYLEKVILLCYLIHVKLFGTKYPSSAKTQTGSKENKE